MVTGDQAPAVLDDTGMPFARDSSVVAAEAIPDWQRLLREEVSKSLASNDGLHDGGRMQAWTRAFETAVLGEALRHTRGRRMEAALLLGIGRNTMTRKIADLQLEGDR